MAHLSCVGSTREELADDPRRHAPGRDRERARPARRPAAGRERLEAASRRPAVLHRAGRADPRRPRRLHRRRLLPRGPSRGPGPGPRPALPQGQGRQRRLVPHHAAVLRQRAVLPLRRRGAGGRHRRADHPGHHADHRPAARSRRSPACAGRRSRRRCSRRSSGARTIPTPCSSSASPTPRCSAPSCWPAARPGIHFYTLNRSPATRAILSALRLHRPWVAREVVKTAVAMIFEGVGDRRLPVDLVAHVDLVVALVGPDPPEAQEPGPRAQLLADQLALEQQLALGDPVVGAQLLAHAVDVDLERRPHPRGQRHAPVPRHPVVTRSAGDERQHRRRPPAAALAQVAAQDALLDEPGAPRGGRPSPRCRAR